MTNDDYKKLAEGHEIWQEIDASWRLEGIELPDEMKIIVGKMIAGHFTPDEGMDEIRRQLDITFDPTQAALIESKV